MTEDAIPEEILKVVGVRERMEYLRTVRRRVAEHWESEIRDQQKYFNKNRRDVESQPVQAAALPSYEEFPFQGHITEVSPHLHQSESSRENQQERLYPRLTSN